MSGRWLAVRSRELTSRDNLGRVHGVYGSGGSGILTVTSAVPAATTHATTVFLSTARATATAAMAAGASVVTGSNGGSIFTRDGDMTGLGSYGLVGTAALMRRAGADPDDPAKAWGTELWVQWTGWIALGSILPCALAYIVSRRSGP